MKGDNYIGNRKTFTKKQLKTIEKETVFSVREYEDYYYFSWCTDAGEDFGFEINKEERGNMIQTIIVISNSFDAEKHAVMWYGANRGEPSSIRTLLEDADKIDENLKKLAEVVSHFE